MNKVETAPVTMTAHELELFAYHVTVLSRQSGKFGLSLKDKHVEVEVEDKPSSMSDVWDSVTMDGHWVGNRQGAASAYAKLVAGDPEWWRSR